MSNLTRNTGHNVFLGFLLGFGLRRLYDSYNRKTFLKKYHKTGEIPKKKSLAIAILLTCIFGSFGLFYIAPRTAIPMLIIDLPFILLLLLFLLVSILLRPIIVFVAVVATISHNAVAKQLFGEHRGVA